MKHLLFLICIALLAASCSKQLTLSSTPTATIHKIDTSDVVVLQNPYVTPNFTVFYDTVPELFTSSDHTYMLSKSQNGLGYMTKAPSVVQMQVKGLVSPQQQAKREKAIWKKTKWIVSGVSLGFIGILMYQDYAGRK